MKKLLRKMGVVKNRRIGHYVVVHERNVYRVWEETHLRRLLHELEVDCILDVGANTGQYAAMLRLECDYRGLIISFEPNPMLAEGLRRRSERDKHWHIETIALSNADGQASFNVMRGHQFSSFAAPLHDETDLFAGQNVIDHAVMVDTETLTTAYNRLRSRYDFVRPFLKLDTQGHDVSIVRSGEEVMSKFVGMQSELSFKRIYSSSISYSEALSTYERLGFQLSAIVPNNSGHFPLLIEADCIMVRGENSSRVHREP